MSRPRSVPTLALAALAAALSACSSGLAPSRPAGDHYVPVRSIDFSSHDDILIRNADGTLQPMDQPYHHAVLIAPGTWQIESDGDYSYLVEGSREALAIDSGYGAGNIRAFLQTLTRKPVRYVANTHFHFDHTADDAYFDGAYMSKDTAEKATTPFPSFAGIRFPRDYPKMIVHDGDRIRLGGRTLEVMIVPNHTPGGTVYLDRKARILFSGDEIMDPTEPLNVSVAAFAANMRKLEAHRRDYDRLAGGPGILPATDVDTYLAAAERVLAGDPGVPPAPHRGQPAPPPDPQGRTIYQRRMVRAPDRPASMGAINPDMRVERYGDRQISFDDRHVQE